MRGNSPTRATMRIIDGSSRSRRAADSTLTFLLISSRRARLCDIVEVQRLPCSAARMPYSSPCSDRASCVHARSFSRLSSGRARSYRVVIPRTRCREFEIWIQFTNDLMLKRRLPHLQIVRVRLRARTRLSSLCDTSPMTSKGFRRIALGMDGATKASHMNHPDFRARERKNLRARSTKIKRAAWRR